MATKSISKREGFWFSAILPDSLRFRFYRALCWLTADFISFVFIYVWSYRKIVIDQNLLKAFPLVSNSELKKIRNRYYHHMSDLIVEPFLLDNLERKDLEKLIRYENLPLIRNFIKDNKDIVLMASHYGNWEYLFSLPNYVGADVLAAYSPLSNGFLNKKLERMRGRFGVKLIPKSDWYRSALNWDNNSPAIFTCVADQRPSKLSQQTIQFFNTKTSVQSGSARIASRRNCAVVYLDVKKRAQNAYSFKFVLLDAGEGDLDENMLISKYYSELEKTIRNQPELWLWSHNRWKF